MTRRLHLGIVWTTFVVSRVIIFLYYSDCADIRTYADYARTHGSSSLKELYDSRDIEYPPVAMVAILAPRVWSGSVAGLSSFVPVLRRLSSAYELQHDVSPHRVTVDEL